MLMFKKESLINLFKTSKIEETIFVIILAIILFKFLIFQHYPESDEVVSITLLSSFKTSLIKFYGHNHFLSTQIGNLIIFIFGVDIMKIRLLSLISFFLILFIVQKQFKDYSKTFIYIFVYLYVDLIITYFSLYRGYGISALLSTLIFFLIDRESYNLKNSKLLYFIMAIIILHCEVNVYLVLPILISMNLKYLRNTNKFEINSYKNFFLYFIIPFSSIYLMFCFTEGLYASKIFVSFSNMKDIAPLIFTNLFDLIYTGFTRLISNEANSVKLFLTFDYFITNIKTNPLFFSIFVISFFKSIYFLFLKKKNDLIHLIIFTFFITFLLINRNGPPRIYTGFISFFIIYILRDLNLNLLNNEKFNFKIIFNYVLLLLIFFKLSNLNFVRLEDLKEKYLIFEKNLENCNFPSKYHSAEFDKHFEYFVYLQECKAKPDINKFYNYYKF